MKRLNLFLLGLAALTISMVFTSCESDDNSAPSIAFTNGITTGETANSSYTITGTITSEAGLKSVHFMKVTTAGEDQLGSETSFTDKNEYSFQFTVTGITEDLTIKVQATDKDDQVTSRNFEITYTGGALTTVGNAELGATSSSVGSYYSVSENTVYTTSTVGSHADKVDIVFNSDASTATIYSPSLSNNSTVSGTGRVTKFEKVTFDFESATAADVNGVDPSDTEINIAKGDVVVYLTADDLKGVFKVTDLTVATNGTVTISVKVKE